MLELENEFSLLIKQSITEQQQDDDVDTDEEVLCSGIQQCHTDLRDLKVFMRVHHHFRAETNTVHNWKKRGFAFSMDARQN